MNLLTIYHFGDKDPFIMVRPGFTVTKEWVLHFSWVQRLFFVAGLNRHITDASVSLWDDRDQQIKQQDYVEDTA